MGVEGRGQRCPDRLGVRTRYTSVASTRIMPPPRRTRRRSVDRSRPTRTTRTAPSRAQRPGSSRTEKASPMAGRRCRVRSRRRGHASSTEALADQRRREVVQRRAPRNRTTTRPGPSHRVRTRSGEVGEQAPASGSIVPTSSLFGHVSDRRTAAGRRRPTSAPSGTAADGHRISWRDLAQHRPPRPLRQARNHEEAHASTVEARDGRGTEIVHRGDKGAAGGTGAWTTSTAPIQRAKVGRATDATPYSVARGSGR